MAATAADLIAAKTRGAVRVPEDVLKELRALCKHNDGADTRARVGRNAVIDMLRGHKICVGSDGLDRICREHLGRKSWATK